MNSLQVREGDFFHDGVQNETNPEVFLDPMEEGRDVGCNGGGAATTPCGGGEGGREIWIHGRDQEEDLLNVEAPIFYGAFPSLPDFPCMSSSSSSSSSSTPAPVKANTPLSSSSASSSSSATSWAVLKSEAEQDAERRNYLDYDRYNYSNHHSNTYTYYDDQDQPLSMASLSSTASMEMPHEHLPQLQLQTSNHHQEQQVVEGADCMDVMESFGYMDLLENNDFFDPPSIFNADEDNKLLEELRYYQQEEEKKPSDQQKQVVFSANDESILQDLKSDGTEQLGGGSCASEDLAMVFLDWLKNNKETVSAEDLRRVKIKKSTIECAASRLGGGKEAMKQLLKLILEWVQTNHLQKRRLMMSNTKTTSTLSDYQYQQDPAVLQSPNPSPSPSTSNPTLNCTSFPQPDHSCFTPSPWINPNQPYVPAETLVPGFPPMGGYGGDPFGNGSACNIKYPPIPVDYHMLGSSHAQWAPASSGIRLAPNYTSFPENNLHPVSPPTPLNPPFSGFGNQCPYSQPYRPGQGGGGGGADNVMATLGSTATKEARKKRMARQRRFLSHHRNHHNSHNSNYPNQRHPNQAIEPHARLGNDNGNGALNAGQSNPANWIYWPPTGANSTSPVLPGDAPLERSSMQGQNFQRQVAPDKRQGWKSEKNLKFLLQKVLKQSDVGNLGRIVLPKKEAENHLPELEARDGISIAMEDIGTSRVWNMRYRFWPNNKSRMYLLENTGDFVRTNGLQEGDFIVIYSDIKCGKYLIRGVKVRQQGQKMENKRPGKSQRKGYANSPCAVNNGIGSASSTPTNQTVH